MNETGRSEKADWQRRCETCRYWEPHDPYRCMNRDGVFYGDLMGPDEKCEEWAMDGNVNRKGSDA